MHAKHLVLIISVPPQPTLLSPVLSCDVPLSQSRSVVIYWMVSLHSFTVVYVCVGVVCFLCSVCLVWREGGEGGVSRRRECDDSPDSRRDCLF